MKRIAYVLGSLLALGIVAALFAFSQFSRFLGSPLTVPDDGVSFEIRPGTPFGEVSTQLERDGIVANADLLRLYARWTKQASSVQAGEYRIKTGTTPRELLEQFTSGGVQLYSFTIIEGWDHRDLLQELQKHAHVKAEMTSDDWSPLLEALGAAATHPEGLFLPETYRFPKGTSDRELLTQAYELMQQTLADEWSSRADDTPAQSPYEALILASIVEKETARADERERIAGVFARRLQKRMRLQTDPTVIYGLGPDFNGNITRRDLQADTPYNTYTRGGLPPTPIALPGRAAIYAALHPADGSELYFVATGVGDGSHRFSATKEEHDEAVKDYLKQLRSQRR